MDATSVEAERPREAPSEHVSAVGGMGATVVEAERTLEGVEHDEKFLGSKLHFPARTEVHDGRWDSGTPVERTCARQPAKE